MDLSPEPWACISPELFPPPVLSAIPSPEPREGSLVTLRCQTKLHPLRSALRLLISFHKDGRTLQDRGPHPELCIPGVKGGDSGLYRCEAALEGGQVQKQSPQLEVRVWAPVSRPVLTLHHGPADPAAGDMVQLLCEAQKGSPPIRYSFYLDEKIVGNHSAPCGGNATLLFPVTSEHDAGIPSCEAENRVCRGVRPKALPCWCILSSNWAQSPGGPRLCCVHPQLSRSEEKLRRKFEKGMVTLPLTTSQIKETSRRKLRELWNVALQASIVGGGDEMCGQMTRG
nr:Fc receptor-like protein 6 isoform X1 [Aotus nancymaae]